uniref:Uncharacterized protein n=1 Tax=Arundo donax TaxID=35708 RepID=A0A0A9C3R4_ARUDO
MIVSEIQYHSDKHIVDLVVYIIKQPGRPPLERLNESYCGSLNMLWSQRSLHTATYG